MDRKEADRKPNDDRKRHEYYMNIAMAVRKNANCLGRRVGAVMVKENRIISTGYNGTPEGFTNCLDGGCVRCRDRDVFRAKNSVGYDVCLCVHAEMNALLQAGKLARGCTLYLAGFDVETGELTRIWPCFLCSKMIVNSGVGSVIMRTGTETFEEMDPIALYRMRSREALGDEGS